MDSKSIASRMQSTADNIIPFSHEFLRFVVARIEKENGTCRRLHRVCGYGTRHMCGCVCVILPESVSVPQIGSLVTPPEIAWTAPFSFRRALKRFSSSTVSDKCVFCILSRSFCRGRKEYRTNKCKPMEDKGKLLGVQCSDIMSITIDADDI